MGTERWFYREFNTDGDEINREQGWLPGVEVAALWQVRESDNHLYLQYVRQQGALGYVGETQAGVAHKTRTDEKTRQYRISWRWMPDSVYVGVGFQQAGWDREIRPANGVLQLHEYYRWLGPVLEAGFRYQPSVWTFDVGVYAGWWMQGNLQVDLRHVGYGKPEIPLHDGYEAGINLDLKYPLSERWYLLFRHRQTIRYFPASDYVTAYQGAARIDIYEPDSRHYTQSYWSGLHYQF